MSSSSNDVIVMDPFALRQFDSSGGHVGIPCSPVEIVERVNAAYNSSQHKPQHGLSDGYAPFCKHIFIPNFMPSLQASYLQIEADNQKLLHTEYQARTEKELPVLTRFFKKNEVNAPQATWLDIILYSKEQIAKENEAMNNPVDAHPSNPSWRWGIVSIKPQTVDYETPMNPITIMRNALGVEHGGSGIALDRAAYMRSVEFWTKHALIM